MAFSGEVTDDESGLEKVTETSMNPGLKGRDLRDAFAATGEYNVMLVANKFVNCTAPRARIAGQATF